MVDQERLLPHDIGAEEGLLGSIIINGEVINDLIGKVTAQDFYRGAHRAIWEAVEQLYADSVHIDQITLSQQLKANGTFERVGGMAALSNLVEITPTWHHAQWYAGLVTKLARQRLLIATTSTLHEKAYEDDLEEVIGLGLTELLAIQTAQADNRPESMKEIVSRYHDELVGTILARETDTEGIPTGFCDLDRLLSGWQKGSAYIMGARTSMGKTMIALGFALKLALRNRPIFIFSLELGKREIAERLKFSLAKVDRRGFKGLSPDAPERDEINKRLFAAVDTLDTLPITVDDRKGLTVVDIRATLQAYCRLYGPPSLVIVDYLNLIQAENTRKSAYEMTTEVVTRIRDLAGMFDVPLLLLAQLNRNSESRASEARRPVMADFRDSGAIEQVASVLMGLYRPSYYFTEEEWEKEHPGERYPASLVEISVLKQSNGPTGIVELHCNMATGFVGNYMRNEG